MSHRGILQKIGGSVTGLLLDTVNAKGAWSFRKLRTAYNGNCIRVRRSSDNTESDIGFVGDVIDTASLLSFVGAGDGLVHTWYDQTGNGYNLIQSTTITRQLRIVSSGSLVTSHGSKAAMQTYNASHGFTRISRTPWNFLHQSAATISIVSNTAGGTYIMDTLDAVPTTTTRIGMSITTAYGINNGLSIGNVVLHNVGASGSKHTLWDYDLSIGTASLRSSLRHNGVDQSANTGIEPASAGVSFQDLTIIGRRGGESQQNGPYQEFVIWDSRQDANRAFIETNTNTYYSIY